jgi:replicative DNA helicase
MINTHYGKIPPQNIEIEECLLTNMIMSGNKAIDQFINELNEELFYKEDNQDLFRIIVGLYRKNKVIDFNTVLDQCRIEGKDTGHLTDLIMSDRLQSTSYSELTNKDYINRLQQKYVRRRAITMIQELDQKVYDEMTHDLEMYSVIEDAYEEIANIVNGKSEISTFDEVLKLSLTKLQDRTQDRLSGIIAGVHTGIDELNTMIAGWQNGELIVIAARPSMGKTAMALHFAQSAAERGKPVLIFSLEMSKNKLADRIILGESDVESKQYNHGNLDQKEQLQVSEAAQKLSSLPIYIDDKSGINIDYITSICRLNVRKNAVKLVVIDYLQLIDMPNDKGATRDQTIGIVTRKLKALSKELDIPIILLSQLNRSLETRTSKIPQLADLRESGNIEQDADLVIFLYRPAYYKILVDESGKPTDNLLMLITAKYRNGAMYDIPLWHNDTLTKFKGYDSGTQKLPFNFPKGIEPNQSFDYGKQQEITGIAEPF